MGQIINNHGKYKILELKWQNTAYQNLRNTAKEVLRRKCIALYTYIKELKSLKKNELSIQCQKFKK